MLEGYLSRAQLLLEQGRYKDAEDILKGLLRESPQDTWVLYLLTEVYIQLNRLDEARALIDTAIGLSPDSAHLYASKARIAICQRNYKDAEVDLEFALQLEPSNDNYCALWASVKLSRKKYQEALEMADHALALNAENILALNVRSAALVKLDNKEEAFRTIEGALREDPNNPYTHANYGWGLLEKGEHKKSLIHFSEALKNDPNYAYAQSGMLEAIKASNVFYRAFLKYAFWLGNLSGKFQWAVIIGFYLLTRLVEVLAKSNPSLEPLLMPLVVLMGLIAFSTWIILPISNLFLRLHPYGKHLLSKNEKLSSAFVGLSLLLSITGLLGFVFSGSTNFLSIAFFGLAMMLPCGSLFKQRKATIFLSGFTLLLCLVGIIAILVTFQSDDIFNPASTIFLFGFIAFQWISNFFSIRENNR